MVQSSARQVSEHLCNQIGEGLRTVVVVHESDWETTYLRDDLRAEYDREMFTEVVDTFRLERTFQAPELEFRPVGERRAVVHYHENAFVLQFPYSEAKSILISLTPDAGRDLLTFIEECHQIIHSNT